MDTFWKLVSSQRKEGETNESNDKKENSGVKAENTREERASIGTALAKGSDEQHVMTSRVFIESSQPERKGITGEVLPKHESISPAIVAVQLSVWDNILGPSALRLWRNLASASTKSPRQYSHHNEEKRAKRASRDPKNETVMEEDFRPRHLASPTKKEKGRTGDADSGEAITANSGVESSADDLDGSKRDTFDGDLGDFLTSEDKEETSGTTARSVEPDLRRHSVRRCLQKEGDLRKETTLKQEVFLLSGITSGELSSSVAQHTLSGEIFRHQKEGQLDLQFIVCHSLGIMIISCIFEATGRSTLKGANNGKTSSVASFRTRSPQKYSLALILTLEGKKRLLKSHNVIEDRMMQLSMVLRCIINDDTMESAHVASSAMESFRGIVEGTLAPLNRFLDKTPALPVQMTLACAESLPYPLDVESLARIVTSHITTKFHTVVIGKNKILINQLVDLLSFLCPAGTLHLCKRAGEDDKPDKFIPDLLVQGILLGEYGTVEEKLRPADFFASLCAYTVVELLPDKVTVHHGSLPRNYSKLRNEHIKNTIEALSNAALGRSMPESSWQSKDTVLEPLKESATVVNHTVDYLYKLPLTPMLREDYLSHWKTGLFRKALAVTHFVEAEVNAGNTVDVPKTGTDGQRDVGERDFAEESEFLDRDAVKRLRTALNLRDDRYFDMIVCLGDLISPGLYRLATMDSAVIGARVVELLQTL